MCVCVCHLVVAEGEKFKINNQWVNRADGLKIQGSESTKRKRSGCATYIHESCVCVAYNMISFLHPYEVVKSLPVSHLQIKSKLKMWRKMISTVLAVVFVLASASTLAQATAGVAGTPPMG